MPSVNKEVLAELEAKAKELDALKKAGADKFQKLVALVADKLKDGPQGRRSYNQTETYEYLGAAVAKMLKPDIESYEADLAAKAKGTTSVSG